jgi:hypothetical protein
LHRLKVGKGGHAMDIRQFREMQKLLGNEEGAIGYLLAWFMGVPALVLFVIFVLRGFD